MSNRPPGMKVLALLLASPLILAACGGPGVRGQPPADEEAAPPPDNPPPPVTVRFDDKSISLTAYTYCYADVCADGMPPKKPPHVGSPDEVIVEFPLDGWSFGAEFTPAGDECGRQQGTSLEAIDDGSFRLRPVGRADTYDVTLSGQGDGDLFVAFRWTTPKDGPLPKPAATLGIITDYGAGPTAYSTELSLSNLAKTPKKASATITVRAENGKHVTFEASREDHGCEPEGSVYFTAPEAEGKAAAAFGGNRFTYEVEIVLDGVRYIGTATWPDDEIPDYEPYVDLQFTPPLPALGR